MGGGADEVSSSLSSSWWSSRPSSPKVKNEADEVTDINDSAAVLTRDNACFFVRSNEKCSLEVDGVVEVVSVAGR